MIENAYVLVDGQPMSTRLHEHGTQPPDWLESGYLEGPSEEMLKKLVAQGNEVTFYRDGHVIGGCSGVIWGPIDEMYEGHWIVHLDWE